LRGGACRAGVGQGVALRSCTVQRVGDGNTVAGLAVRRGDGGGIRAGVAGLAYVNPVHGNGRLQSAGGVGAGQGQRDFIA
jgi:hypothetical protein